MANAQQKKLKVTLVHSPIGTKETHRACVRGLGLKRLYQRGSDIGGCGQNHRISSY